MCLQLESERTKVKTAKEDIVVYKILRYQSVRKPIQDLSIHDGEEFSGIIWEEKCKGKISIEGDRLYFCTNNANLKGKECKNKKGYRYSWVYDRNVIKIDTSTAHLTKEDFVCKKFITYYQKSIVEEGVTYTSYICKIRSTIHDSLHSYKEHWFDNFVWAECIIPKGSKYYEGTYNREVSFASDTLKYVKIHNDESCV